VSSPAAPQIPLVDLRASYLPIRDELLAAFDRVLGGMELLLGPEQRAFEEAFASYCGTRHAVAVSSGTDALLAALLACGVGTGDEVICPANSFFATVEAVIHAGATPVFVDVDPNTLTLDPGCVRDALSPVTRALLPVHLYGHPADMDPLLELAAEHDLRVIEDAAQAHGARHRGRPCGSLGDAAAFSFYFTKNLGAFGEAGCVTTDDAELAERLRVLRHHGHVSKADHAIAGFNLRMDELQAAVLRIKLRRLDAGNARRREIAARYDDRFAGCPGIRTLLVRPHCEAVHHLYAIRSAQRDRLREHLAHAGVATGIHYPIPAHRQPALAHHRHRCGELGVTEQVCAELLSLPIYPELRDEQVETVARAVREFAQSGRGAAA
jgi:dTDP-4-amino-4,6-dideoxygalactose transaminase